MELNQEANTLSQRLSELINLQYQQLSSLKEMTSIQRENNVTNIGASQQQYYSQSMNQGAPTNVKDLFKYQNYAQPYTSPAAQFYGVGQQYSPYAFSVAGRQLQASGQSFSNGLQGVLGANSLNTFTMTQNQIQNANNQAAAGIAKGVIAGTSGLASAAVSIGSQMLGAVPGVMLGLAGGMVVEKVGKDAIKGYETQSDIRSYLNETSSMYINASESANKYTVGGFTNKQMSQVAGFLNDSSKWHMTNDDVMGLLKSFTENRLMTGVSDVKTYEERFSKLTKNVREMVKTLGKSYEEGRELMGEMKRYGFDTDYAAEFAASAKVTSGYTGLSAEAVMQTSMSLGRQSALQTGSDITMSTALQNSLLQYVGVAQNSNDKYATAVDNLGGVDSATAALSGALNDSTYGFNSSFSKAAAQAAATVNKDGTVSIDRDQYENYIRKGDYNSVINIAAQKVNSLNASELSLLNKQLPGRLADLIPQENDFIDLVKIIAQKTMVAQNPDADIDTWAAVLGGNNNNLTDFLQSINDPQALAAIVNPQGSGYKNSDFLNTESILNAASAQETRQAAVSKEAVENPTVIEEIKNIPNEISDYFGKLGESLDNFGSILSTFLSNWGRVTSTVEASTEQAENLATLVSGTNDKITAIERKIKYSSQYGGY